VELGLHHSLQTGLLFKDRVLSDHCVLRHGGSV
jgi:hypothetical protein